MSDLIIIEQTFLSVLYPSTAVYETASKYLAYYLNIDQ